MTKCPPLDLDIDEAECQADFRVIKQHLPRLVEVLHLPPTFACRQRSVWEGVEGFMHAPETSVFFLPIQRYDRSPPERSVFSLLRYDPTVGQFTVRNRRTIKVRGLMGFSAILTRRILDILYSAQHGNQYKDAFA